MISEIKFYIEEKIESIKVLLSFISSIPSWEGKHSQSVTEKFIPKDQLTKLFESLNKLPKGRRSTTHQYRYVSPLETRQKVNKWFFIWK